MNHTIKMTTYLILVFAILGITLCITLYNIQEKLIFHPEILPQDYQFDFEQQFEELYYDVDEKVKINALHFKADSTKGAVLYFHGNAGSLKGWGYIAEDFTRNGYDLLIFDYRGFGKSTGKITNEEGLHNDAEIIYKKLLKDYPEEDIVIYGRSIGTGIAVKLASENSPKMLILETPYFSLPDLAKYHMPYIPHSLALKYTFKTYLWITKVKCPVHIFHGTEDRIVPYNSSIRLLNLLENNIALTTIKGGTHNDLSSYSDYQDKLESLLN
ncbi:MAG: alpha/beta fold hydrolase [Bacteroidota bacterium]